MIRKATAEAMPAILSLRLRVHSGTSMAASQQGVKRKPNCRIGTDTRDGSAEKVAKV
jgi:hypothetical protein